MALHLYSHDLFVHGALECTSECCEQKVIGVSMECLVGLMEKLERRVHVKGECQRRHLAAVVIAGGIVFIANILQACSDIVPVCAVLRR